MKRSYWSSMGSGTVVPSATAFVTTPPCFRFHPVPESVVASKSVRVKAIAHLVSHSLPTHLTLFSYLAYRSREDPEEQVWNYSFKNNTGKVFEGVYGLTRPPRAWWIPNTDFELFVADSSFYHRDQLVPTEAPLDSFGVNYHGNLRLTADRTEIVRDPVLFRLYKTKLQQALDIAIQKFPDLAIRVMGYFMTALGRHHSPQPLNTAHADQYRAAFTAVCHARRPSLFSAEKKVYPYSRRRDAEDVPILTQLDVVPWPVEDWQLDVLEAAGAYISPSKFAERLLLQLAEVPEAELSGVDLFRQYASQILPDRALEVSIRKYPHAQPRCVVKWAQIFLAGPPPCEIVLPTAVVVE